MSFFAELHRRNVVRVGIAYIVIGWVLAQVAEFALEGDRMSLYGCLGPLRE